MRAMASTPSVSMAGIVSFLNDDLVLLMGSPDRQRDETREGKEDTIHDAEHEAGLQHITRLVHRHGDAVHVDGAQGAEGDDVACAGRDVGAVAARHEAQLVNAGDQGAQET